MKKRLFGLLAAGVAGLTAIASTSIFASAVSVGDQLTVDKITQIPKGICDGYTYDLWVDEKSGGTASMKLGKGGVFKAEWNAAIPQGSFLARRGLEFGSRRKATDYGSISLEYEAVFKQTGSQAGNSQFGVSGWFQNRDSEQDIPALVEYFIIEDWTDWVPDGQGKTVTIDGAQYKIFQQDHSGMSINGTVSNFKSYYSVRQSKRTSGRVTVTDHFKAWAKEGWGIGNLYEITLGAEGWQSRGYVDVTKLDVYMQPGDEADILKTLEPRVNYVKPLASVNRSISDDFEDGDTAWQKHGDRTDYGLTADWAYGRSKQSLYVTDRTETGDGFVIDAFAIDTDPMFGHEFSAMVSYKNPDVSSAVFTLNMQYELGGKTVKEELASVTAKSGEWKELKKQMFEVPERAENIKLYVATAYSENPTAADLVSFYMDDVRYGEWVRYTIISTEYVPIDETDTATGIETTTKMTYVTATEIGTNNGYLHTETDPDRIGATTGTEIGTDDCHPPESNESSKTTTETETTAMEDITATSKGTDECHPEYVISGDANQDGKVSVSDAILLARVVAEDTTVTITDTGRQMAELDGKTGLSADDLTILLKMLAGIR